MRKPQFVMVAGASNTVDRIRRTVHACRPYASSFQIVDVGMIESLESLESSISDVHVRKLIEFGDNWNRAYVAAASRVPIDQWYVMVHPTDCPSPAFLKSVDEIIDQCEKESLGVCYSPILCHGDAARLFMDPKGTLCTYPPDQPLQRSMVTLSSQGMFPSLIKRSDKLLISTSVVHGPRPIDKVTMLPLAGPCDPRMVNRYATASEDCIDIMSRAWPTMKLVGCDRIRSSYPRFASFMVAVRKGNVPAYIAEIWSSWKSVQDPVAKIFHTFATVHNMKVSHATNCEEECCRYE